MKMGTVLGVTALGAMAGMRSMAPLATVSRYLNRSKRTLRRAGPLEDLLGSDEAVAILEKLAIAELVADKLPATPHRIEPLPVLTRIATGALAAAALAERRDASRVGAALFGGTKALGTAVCMYYLRRAAGRRLDVADPLLGLVEDGLVLGTAAVLLDRLD